MSADEFAALSAADQRLALHLLAEANANAEERRERRRRDDERKAEDVRRQQALYAQRADERAALEHRIESLAGRTISSVKHELHQDADYDSTKPHGQRIVGYTSKPTLTLLTLTLDDGTEIDAEAQWAEDDRTPGHYAGVSVEFGSRTDRLAGTS